MSRTLQIIRDEHRALAAMLKSIVLLLAQRRDATPDFAALRAMLFYIDEFPEQRHHRKETELLFPKLRARAPQARELLDELDRQHGCGERMIRHLEHALLAWEVMGDSRRSEFERAVDDYARFYLDHMALEEQRVLPLAERLLGDDDWDELDAAFLANGDALAGHQSDEVYAALFTHIVDLVPAPLGYGAPASAGGTGATH